MGDTGSSLLGLAAAWVTIRADRDGLFPLWVGVLMFSPFVVDSTVTLFRRLLKGERVWKAHRTHYYQRLVQLGWGHRRTVLKAYILMILCMGSAMVSVELPTSGQWLLLSGWVVTYTVLIVGVNRLEATVRER